MKFKKSLMNLLSDPRVMKLMQDERVMSAVMKAISLPGKAQQFAHGQVEQVVKAMALATADEVHDLQRTVRRLETELADLRKAQGTKTGNPRNEN